MILNKFLTAVNLLIFGLKGYFQKLLIDLNIYKVPDLNGSNGLIVSLTSYGRRVNTCVVYYTLVSLLRQEEQPSRIILWLDEDEWNQNTIPIRLANIVDKGVEIRYCKNIRSYKKLVPTLELCNGHCIMTFDDDVMYSKDTISTIMNAHRQNSKDILCFCASTPVTMNGVPCLYKTWKEVKRDASGMNLFPVGVGGILYPWGSLHSDITRSDLFMKLCPMADDIWFWFQGQRIGSPKRLITKKGVDACFDIFYQLLNRGSALTHTNKHEGGNDRQFQDLFRYYNCVIVDNEIKEKLIVEKK